MSYAALGAQGKAPHDRRDFSTIHHFNLCSAVAATESIESPDKPADPNTVKEAKASTNWASWREAIEAEIDNFICMGVGTWKKVFVGGNRNVDSRFVFKTKYRLTDGTIERRKVRMVARPFNCRKGIDYFETFAPVATNSSRHCLLATANEKGLELYSTDVTAA